MSNTAKPKRKFNRLHIVLLALALMSVLVTGVTFSSYKSTSSGGGSVQVALFASDYSFDVRITDYYPGCDDKVVTIDIMNHDGGKVCEVSQHYEISAVCMAQALPLEITFDNGKKTASGDLLVSGGEQTFSHTMTISWPEEDNDYKYSDEIEVIRVTVAVTQIN